MFGGPTATFEVVRNTGNPSSEKAGVGGSTPSLATTFSITYLLTKSQSRIKTLQFSGMGDGICLNRLRRTTEFFVEELSYRSAQGKDRGTALMRLRRKPESFKKLIQRHYESERVQRARCS